MSLPWSLGDANLCPTCHASLFLNSKDNVKCASKLAELRAGVLGVLWGSFFYLAAMIVSDIVEGSGLNGLPKAGAGESMALFFLSLVVSYAAYRFAWRRVQTLQGTSLLGPGVYRVEFAVWRLTAFYVVSMFVFMIDVAVLFVYVWVTRGLSGFL